MLQTAGAFTHVALVPSLGPPPRWRLPAPTDEVNALPQVYAASAVLVHAAAAESGSDTTAADSHGDGRPQHQPNQHSDSTRHEASHALPGIRTLPAHQSCTQRHIASRRGFVDVERSATCCSFSSGHANWYVNMPVMTLLMIRVRLA